ncbi:hypothetical protein Tco_0110947 [Tanacetum coccineum]
MLEKQHIATVGVDLKALVVERGLTIMSVAGLDFVNGEKGIVLLMVDGGDKMVKKSRVFQQKMKAVVVEHSRAVVVEQSNGSGVAGI